jgi:hypothetical protein
MEDRLRNMPRGQNANTARNRELTIALPLRERCDQSASFADQTRRSPTLREVAQRVGTTLAHRSVRLIYGGGRVGLMAR